MLLHITLALLLALTRAFVSATDDTCLTIPTVELNKYVCVLVGLADGMLVRW